MKTAILSLLLAFYFLPATHSQKTTENPFEKYYAALQWREIGPYRGGRSCAVTGVRGEPNLFYFGATGGGVWKTTDGGRSWENISDDFFGGSVGSIEVCESDPNVIYVGGGEKTVRGNVSYGYGVWKSEDAGRTWRQMGLERSRHIPRIRVHPDNPDIVWAAVLGDIFKDTEERGIFKSEDGGETWRKVLFVNERAGAVDLCLDPTNPRILYASTWRVHRTPYSLESGGEGSGLWKSTDSGETWTELSKNEGMPEGTLGIIGIAVSHVKPDRVWAIVENAEGGIFRSEDAGKTWKRINSERKLRQRAWYYTRIYADTDDEDLVYVVNVAYHRSKDGGKTFTSHRAPHGDHHDLWIDPDDPDRMIIGDDGGAQVTYDGGETWTTYHNQPTAQFYRVTTDDHFPFRIYAAQQDNSTVRILHRTDGSRITEDDWEPTAGGESAHIAVDPEDNDIVYGGSYGGFLMRIDHRRGQRRAINVWPDNPLGYGAGHMKYRFQWNFPLFFSPHNPDKLYAASNFLHVSYDEGHSWRVISPDLTRNDSTKLGPSGGPITKDNTGVEYYCTIFAAAESPRVKDLIWTGSDDGLVHITHDGGQNWINVTPEGLPEWTMINSLEPDPHRDGGCYLAATSYKNGDFRPYLFKTEDYGETWEQIVEGIDPGHFTRVVRADPVRKGMLFAGTESGMYISWDDGTQWYPFQLNLPIVPITDLTIKDHILIAATQGRGIWTIDDLELLRQVDGLGELEDVTVFRPKPAYRMPGRQAKDPGGAGTNHAPGTQLYVYVSNLADSSACAFTVKTMEGDTIRHFSMDAKEKENKLALEEGSNRMIWDLRYPSAERFEGMVLWGASLQGPKAMPGMYKAILACDGQADSTMIEVVKDPRTDATEEELEDQFTFIREVNRTISEAHRSILEIQDYRKQIKSYTDRLPEEEATSDIRDLADHIDSVFTYIENELYQTKNRSRQDPLNYPIKLTNKIGHLSSLTSIGDYPPTSQAEELRRELTSEIERLVSEYRDLVDKQVSELNQMVRDRGLDYFVPARDPKK